MTVANDDNPYITMALLENLLKQGFKLEHDEDGGKYSVGRFGGVMQKGEYYEGDTLLDVCIKATEGIG